LVSRLCASPCANRRPPPVLRLCLCENALPLASAPRGLRRQGGVLPWWGKGQSLSLIPHVPWRSAVPLGPPRVRRFPLVSHAELRPALRVDRRGGGGESRRGFHGSCRRC